MSKSIFFVLFLAAIAVGVIIMTFNNKINSKQLPELRLSFGIKKEIPDPASINSVGDWYFLKHVSSPLLQYNYERGSFSALLCEKWHIDESNNVYTFIIKDSAKFHDGTKVTAYDVEATIKRLLAKKTSTHFPLWEYIVGCENLDSMNATCAGLKAVDEKTVRIELKTPMDAFFLQLSSPETGIWSKNDIDENSFKLTPKKFSGPYFVATKEEDNTYHLKRNEYSPIIMSFPAAPATITLLPISGLSSEKDLFEGRIDLTIGVYNPYSKDKYRELSLSTYLTHPSNIVYLHSLRSKKYLAVGSELLEKLWANLGDSNIVAADTFLPFRKELSLSKQDFLTLLPKESKMKIKVAVPERVLDSRFIDLLSSQIKAAGAQWEFVIVSIPTFFELLKKTSDNLEYDFVLAPYAASERYPEVQLRYISENRTSPIDLKVAEATVDPKKKSKIMQDYQKWLLENQFVVPLVFLPSQIVYRKGISVGDQPPADVEIALWRITKE